MPSIESAEGDASEASEDQEKLLPLFVYGIMRPDWGDTYRQK